MEQYSKLAGGWISEKTISDLGKIYGKWSKTYAEDVLLGWWNKVRRSAALEDAPNLLLSTKAERQLCQVRFTLLEPCLLSFLSTILSVLLSSAPCCLPCMLFSRFILLGHVLYLRLTESMASPCFKSISTMGRTLRMTRLS